MRAMISSNPIPRSRLSFRSEIASFAVVVDAKDDSARRFYERESFLALPDQPMKLFRPMADIRRLFDEA